MEQTAGDAIITPAVPHLDVESWTNSRTQVGHGYALTLHDLGCRWISQSTLQARRVGSRTYYESPALIGCAFAISRRLYDQLRGFDPHMRSWGVEDLDCGLKAWLLGFSILHDPAAIVGHRLRKSFDNFDVPLEHLWANQLRMARKHFTEAAWHQWVTRFREQHDRVSVSSPDFLNSQPSTLNPPEGPWARAWQTFLADRDSVEQERAYLLSRRVHDEFWYADRFGLDWPRLAGQRGSNPCGCQEQQVTEVEPKKKTAAETKRLSDPLFAIQMPASPEPSPSPSPAPCKVNSVSPANAVICLNSNKTLTADVEHAGAIEWSAPGADTESGSGSSFLTKWSTPGIKTVTASCGASSISVNVTVGQFTLIPDWSPVPIRIGYFKPNNASMLRSMSILCEPAELAANVAISSSMPSRFAVSDIERDPVWGHVTFKIEGKSPTPATHEEGDARIRVMLNGQECTSWNVVVVVPKSLRTPYPQKTAQNGVVSPQNLLVDRNTSPVYTGNLGDNQVARCTAWFHWLDVGVDDQFGNPLDLLYDGAIVEEQFGSDPKFSINQPLNGNGVYGDPVGVIRYANPDKVLQNSTEAVDWPSAPTLPMPQSFNDNQNIQVFVGGHQTNNVVRRVIGQPPSTVIVQWPPQ